MTTPHTRLFAVCTCRWEPSNILGLDAADRVLDPSCARHADPTAEGELSRHPGRPLGPEAPRTERTP